MLRRLVKCLFKSAQRLLNIDCWLKSGSLKRIRTTDGEEKQALYVSFKINKPTLVECNPSKSSVRPTVKIRKYNSDYLGIGFTCTGTEHEPKPQCVVCYVSLSNECMKPAKLRRHLGTRHPEHKGKSLDFFKIKL